MPGCLVVGRNCTGVISSPYRRRTGARGECGWQPHARSQFRRLASIHRQIHHRSAELNAADLFIFIVKVPTPIEHERRPDLEAAAQNLAIVRKVIRKGAIVVYESTVYPGGYKEDGIWCSSGHSARRDFTVGHCLSASIPATWRTASRPDSLFRRRQDE
jgi:hypothetical protein